jgi:hypothetical protein
LIVAAGKVFLVVIKVRSPIFGYLTKASEGACLPLLGTSAYLSHLNLSHISLLGSLPKGFFSTLNRLKVLDLSYNHLSGDASGWPDSIQIVDISILL